LPLDLAIARYADFFLILAFLVALLLVSLLNVKRILTESSLTKIDLGVFLALDIFFIVVAIGILWG